ncbi:MAG: aldo/keto reductase [Gemmatimonadaceae bacterium]
MSFPSGHIVPALGLGTWKMAESKRRRADEMAALRLGLDLGLTVIDTAEMYANGAAESLVGEALDGRERQDVFLVSKGGASVACNQVLYNLSRRGIEIDLLPWCRHHGVPVMAYSPIEQGNLLTHAAVERVAVRHDATPVQICLAWVLRQRGVIAIPKAGTPSHVREDAGAPHLVLTDDDLRELDEAFPPPRESRPLEMI